MVDTYSEDIGLTTSTIDISSEVEPFSIRSDAPLDMRMNKMQDIDAYKVVNEYDEEALADIFYYCG